MLVSQNVTSWNQISIWLLALQRLRTAARIQASNPLDESSQQESVSNSCSGHADPGFSGSPALHEIHTQQIGV
jgi:hypothetical protein